MMRAKIIVERPEDIEMTLKLTMPISEWDRLRGQLSLGYPAWKLTSAINEMILRARATYYAKDSDAFDVAPAAEAAE